jgi:hypothetical protein
MPGMAAMQEPRAANSRLHGKLEGLQASLRPCTAAHNEPKLLRITPVPPAARARRKCSSAQHAGALMHATNAMPDSPGARPNGSHETARVPHAMQDAQNA